MNGAAIASSGIIAAAAQTSGRDCGRGGRRTWKEAEKLTENGEDAMMAKTDAKGSNRR
jgi:hypothetical protein